MRIEKENYETYESKKVTKQRDVFITEDGEKFPNKEKAELHEKKLKIPSKYFYSGVEMNGTFYYLKTMEDITTLGFDYYLRRGQISEKDFVLPDWYLFTEDEAPNGYFLTVQSLSSIRESLEESLRELPTDEEIK